MLENNQKELVLIEDLGYLYPTATSRQKAKFGLYKCFCGNEFKAIQYNIQRGNSFGCGCSRGKNNIHNLSSHRLYHIWKAMIKRCNSYKNKDYINYGYRGISVCNEWLDINIFIRDMEDTYQEGLSIDRIDNNLGYSKDNCRWTTKTTQARNTRILRIDNTSGYRGVTLVRDKYRAIINVNKKPIHLGYFNTALEAAKAYDNYVIENNLEHTRNFS